MKKSQVPSVDYAAIGARTNRSVDDVDQFVGLLRRAMESFSIRVPVIENGELRYYTVERRGLGPLRPRNYHDDTNLGVFWEFTFHVDDEWRKYTALVKADINPDSFMPVFKNPDQLIVRTDSGCETGQVFGDQTCECCDQLRLALATIAEAGEGLIIHIPRQDGRGMGLPFKLATLWAQEVLKVNTVESASLLAPGGIIDVRTYAGVVAILKFFGVPETCRISLATNNPKKTAVFHENDYLTDYLPVVVAPTEHTAAHLLAKQNHLGHRDLVNGNGAPHERN